MVYRLDSRDPGFAAAFDALLNSKREVSEEVGTAVAAILADVKARGDAAVIEYTERFDRLPLTPGTLAFTADEIAAAEARTKAWRRRMASQSRILTPGTGPRAAAQDERPPAGQRAG